MHLYIYIYVHIRMFLSYELYVFVLLFVRSFLVCYFLFGLSQKYKIQKYGRLCFCRRLSYLSLYYTLFMSFVTTYCVFIAYLYTCIQASRLVMCFVSCFLANVTHQGGCFRLASTSSIYGGVSVYGSGGL